MSTIAASFQSRWARRGGPQFVIATVTRPPARVMLPVHDSALVRADAQIAAWHKLRRARLLL